jgi:ribosomal protein L7/L12
MAEDLEQQIQSLLDQGQKIKAVKLYKHRTGASLRKSREAVESIGCGKSQTVPSELGSDMEAELLRLLEAGRKIEATRIYKERMGVQLIEAKQAVEALAARHGIVAKGCGCAGVLAAMVVVVVVLAAVFL